MPNAKFDSKSFNAEAFGYAVKRIPNLKLNEMRKSRALAGNPDIKNLFANQDGTSYARVAMRGLLDGQVLNYDGQTDITATTTKTYEQGVVVIGRAKAWMEKDFSYDITGGVDFMDNVAAQVAEYFEGVDQDTILSILKGIFAMTGTKNLEFVNAHTYDAANITDDGKMSATTMNSATQRACGDNKKKFSMCFMDSVTSTHLENLNAITYLTYTDKEGMTRELGIGTWNGKTVVIDDSMPVIEGYYDAESATPGALKVVANTATPSTGEIKLSAVTPYFGTKTLAANHYVIAGERHVTYVLGQGAISYEPIGAKVPHEMVRDPKTNGGEDILYARRRNVFAPFGISYEKTSQTTLSPTNAELENGANWALVHSGEASAANRSYLNHKAIPIARIFTRG